MGVGDGVLMMPSTVYERWIAAVGRCERPKGLYGATRQGQVVERSSARRIGNRFSVKGVIRRIEI